MSEISPELVERMVAHFRSVHKHYEGYRDIENPHLAEVREIFSLLPVPVDPDLIEAREIVKATLTEGNHKRCNCRSEIDAGEWDNGQKVRATLAGIKRGRELAASS